MKSNLEVGKTYQVTIMDGYSFIGIFNRQERGFFVFLDSNGIQCPFRIENVLKAKINTNTH
jgi:hypothetical protein